MILKIYKNGHWVPVVGYNTAAENKINTVANAAAYTYTHNNTQHTVNGITQFDLPLFRASADSPNELFDAGTLGYSINEYVTTEEWQNIFNNPNFYNAWNITSNHLNIARASSNKLGGIWANYFSTIDGAAAEYVEPKFKTSQANQGDNKLYSYAGDIISAINAYSNNHSGGSNLIIPLATHLKVGGLKMQEDPIPSSDYRGVPVVFGGPNIGLTYGGTLPSGVILYGDLQQYNADNSFPYIPGWALVDWMKNPTGVVNPIPFVQGWRGVDSEVPSGEDCIFVGLNNWYEAKIGTIPRKTSTGLEWVDTGSSIGLFTDTDPGLCPKGIPNG